MKATMKHIFLFAGNKQMQTFREAIPFQKVCSFVSARPDAEGYHRCKWCISALFRKKRLPLEGKLSPTGD